MGRFYQTAIVHPVEYNLEFWESRVNDVIGPQQQEAWKTSSQNSLHIAESVGNTPIAISHYITTLKSNMCHFPFILVSTWHRCSAILQSTFGQLYSKTLSLSSWQADPDTVYCLYRQRQDLILDSHLSRETQSKLSQRSQSGP